VELTLEPLVERLGPAIPDMKIQLADRHPGGRRARGELRVRKFIGHKE